MAKKKKATTSRKAPRKGSRKDPWKEKTRACGPPPLKPKAEAAAKKTLPSPPTPSPPSTSPTTPDPEKSTELHPAVPMVVSLLAPGLGLLLWKNRDHVKDAFIIFGVWFSYVAVSFVLTFLIVGVCCWLPLPLLNVAAGIHSFDEATLEQGGKPLLFQKGFRILRG